MGLRASLDYLVNVDYNDGIANEYQTWTYDDAGNRASDSTVSGSWTYDNLNRMTASPGISSYTNDILGNRTQRQPSGSPAPVPTNYQWDALNRMTYYTPGIGHDDYIYRADGMRVYKNHVSGMVHEEEEGEAGDVDYSARFFYDGQMQVESKETYLSGNNWLTKYGVGARGIDYMERSYNGWTAAVAFPVYDGHGNMIATIGRSGSTYALGDQREYDVWGRIRAGNSTGDPKPRYCANLGHVQDDESGLIYMRARYYEPGTGRFVSEDHAKDGTNWFIYAMNQPIACADPTGSEAMDIYKQTAMFGMLIGFFSMMGFYFGTESDPFAIRAATAGGALTAFVGAFVCFMIKMSAGTEGLGNRWPLRGGNYLIGGARVAGAAWLGGYSAGILYLGLAAIGNYLGKVLFHLLWTEFPEL